MIGDIKVLLGEHSKKLRKPIILLTIDSLFNMFFYSILYFVLLDLINSQLSFSKIKNYTSVYI